MREIQVSKEAIKEVEQELETRETLWLFWLVLVLSGATIAAIVINVFMHKFCS